MLVPKKRFTGCPLKHLYRLRNTPVFCTNFKLTSFPNDNSQNYGRTIPEWLNWRNEENTAIIHTSKMLRNTSTASAYMWASFICKMGKRENWESENRKQQTTHISVTLIVPSFSQCHQREGFLQLPWAMEKKWILQYVDMYIDMLFSVNSPWKMLIC